MKLYFKKEHYHKGTVEEFYTAKAIYNNINFNITYDSQKDSVMVHEWYKFNNNQLSDIQEQVKLYFKNKANSRRVV